MMISTKGRYALRVLVDLAEQGSESPVPLKDIARRQGMSDKYLQHIAKLLVDKGLLVGSSGKGGGYLMTRAPADCTVADVLEATEGTLAPVACLNCSENECERQESCKTLPLWQRYFDLTHTFFEGVTIQDLLDRSLA